MTSTINIRVLTDFLNTLSSYSHDLVQHLRSGQKLCHYTSLEGATSIISGGDLWFTNSRYCNDDEELKYGHRVVDEVLEDLEREVAANTSRLEWLHRLRLAVNAVRGDQIYICCY